jgi:site-specific DNA recombinase
METKNITKKIGVAYIRESTEEQDKGFSPEAQEKGIRVYAERNNIKIVETYKDLISGRLAAKRTDFQRMLDDAMQKKFEAILVYHTSRFARNVQESRQYKDLLRKKLGIDVVSVTQNFGDFNDPSSFLNEGVNELFDEFQSRNIGFWVRSGLMMKRSQGKPIGGSPPFGYYKKKISFDPDRNRPIYSKEWHIHKKDAEIVRRIFKMYASGDYSMQKISEILTKEGHRTRFGNPFTYSSVKCILPNKSYIGLVWSPRKPLPDLKSIMHKPIISKELFNKCQDVLKERKGKYGRPVAKHRFYLLQGLVYCYPCIKHLKKNEAKLNKVMHPSMYCEYRFQNGKKGGKEKLFYCCKFHRENKTCKQLPVECGIIDKQVIQLMNGFNLPDDIIQMTLEKLRGMFKISRKETKRDDRIFEILSRKKRVKTQFEYGHIPETEYLFKIQRADEEIEQLERQGVVQNMTASQQEQHIKKTEEFLKDFPKFWSQVEKEEKREWIRMAIKRIWVKDKKVVAIEPRDDFKALFSAHRKVIGQSPILAPL